MKMRYPTLSQVESADREQVCRWIRFLPSPGEDAIGRFDHQLVLEVQTAIMDRICERFKEFGGFTPELSKKIGWTQ